MADLRFGKVDLLPGHSKRASALSWSPHNLVLASGSHDTTLRLWTFDEAGSLRASGQLRSSAAHTGDVEALCWSRSEPTFASAAADQSVRFWDARSGKNEGILPLPAGTGVIINMAWSNDGATLAAGTDRDELLLIDARKAVLEARKAAIVLSKQMDFELNQLAWSGSGLLLLAAGSKTDADTYSGSVRVTRPRAVAGAPTGLDRIAQLSAHAAQTQCVRFDPTGRWFATGGLDASVSLWDAEDLAVVRVFDRFDTSVNVVTFSADSAFLAVGTELERSMDVIRVADGALVRSTPVGGAVRALDWSSKGHVLAFTVDDKDIAAVRIMRGTLVAAAA